jgi:hypothetical protein
MITPDFQNVLDWTTILIEEAVAEKDPVEEVLDFSIQGPPFPLLFHLNPRQSRTLLPVHRQIQTMMGLQMHSLRKLQIPQKCTCQKSHPKVNRKDFP